ncbi:hypothetical protein [Iningainema tapete]|uniref:Uncharacterized protein n=1 Tax=Iningainema tapete BLCC-T55 TaxID=2748662 RepID=A0A8J6XGD4_9CYAN|nr:hypothetical protein [Iningainema tapete]MBD2775374.1 hypothetical protein [Iningainema tapete BLCC-T55]
MRLNKSLILIGAVGLVTLGGVTASPALADNPYRDYRVNRTQEISRVREIDRIQEIRRAQEARRAYEARRERERREREAFRLRRW